MILPESVLVWAGVTAARTQSGALVLYIDTAQPGHSYNYG